MADCTVLTITSDEQFLNLLRKELHDPAGGGNPIIVASGMEEACSLLPMAHPRLIIVHWSHHGGRSEELNRLLWATTVLATSVPVLVIVDRYRVDQATTFFRMGVTDYISRTHHGDQLGRILDTYLHHRRTSSTIETTSESPTQTVKPWSSKSKRLKAQVV